MRRDLLGWLAFLAIALLTPLVIGSDRYLIFLANVMLMFMTLAMSWDVVARTGQLSLAHGAFFGLGAYGVAIAFKTWSVPTLPAIVLATLACAAIALGLGVVTLRLRGIYFAIATLAFAQVWQTVLLQVPDISGGTVGISMPPLFDGDRIASYYLAVVIFAVALALSLAVRWTSWHYAVSAIRANETVARVVGLDVVRVKVALFTASATLAALAGAFYTPFITHIDPFDAFSVDRSVASLVFPIFGGLYTSAGPVIGTIVLRSLEEYLRVTPPWKDGYQVLYGLVIVVAVLFMPRGVLGLGARYAGRWPWRSSR